MTFHEVVAADVSPVLASGQSTIESVWHYNCKLGAQRIDASLLPPMQARNARKWHDIFSDILTTTTDLLGLVARWASKMINQVPHGIDTARDVDGGGYTLDDITPTMFTEWVRLDSNTYARFSQARTAMHSTMYATNGLMGGGALRSSVMGGVNSRPSLDLRDAVTLAIMNLQETKMPGFHGLMPGQGGILT